MSRCCITLTHPKREFCKAFIDRSTIYKYSPYQGPMRTTYTGHTSLSLSSSSSSPVPTTFPLSTSLHRTTQVLFGAKAAKLPHYVGISETPKTPQKNCGGNGAFEKILETWSPAPSWLSSRWQKSLLYSNNIDFLVLQMDSDSGWMMVFHQSWYFT